MRAFAARHRAVLVAAGCIALVAGGVGVAALAHHDPSDRSETPLAAGAPLANEAAPTSSTMPAPPSGVLGVASGHGAASYQPYPPGPPSLTGPTGPVPPETPPTMPYPGPSSLPLPPPGAEQPADPAGARQAVVDLIARAWTPDLTDAQRFENFDDAHGFDEVMRELRSGPVATQANSAVSATADDVVFLTPTQADIKFTFTIANYGRATGFFGIANLRNGAWKLTRSTFCNALFTTGAKCPAS
jgi:hypothetical protein